MAFQAVQQRFIDYIRDPNRPLPEGTDLRRMTIYRELFFNNMKGFVDNGFPVLRSLYHERDWLALVQDFFVKHDCSSPIFLDIAQEFLLFLQDEYQPGPGDPDFMLELAHYEWLELVVATEQDDPLQQVITLEQIDSVKLVLSASAKVAQYRYEVQRISPEYRPEIPSHEPQFFCIYRDAEDEVCFLQLQALSAQVLGYISQQGQVFQAICDWLAATYPEMAAGVLESGCRQLLQQMIAKGIVMGDRT
ncbi:putative DNA-binding domain-containing protein [Shewanella sp. AS1]|uniref:HvfC family RiPP maturation protein n=1 Tax=Shewanella sp. AS1 TaxID=2907626 RepID=UPI001F22CEAF|nr:putative DNA-binding domain-containing protein [Shewanella sp. AS1]MCE9678651.1 putative DNA-binding domain-containing protein [Shewanella sp. AS1]